MIIIFNEGMNPHVSMMLGASGISEVFAITLFSLLHDSITTHRLCSREVDMFLHYYTKFVPKRLLQASSHASQSISFEGMANYEKQGKQEAAYPIPIPCLRCLTVL